jgi:hypothetical protein
MMYKPNMMLRVVGAAVVALLCASTAFAQQPGRIRGQIESMDGSNFTLKTRDGATLKMKIDDKTRVAALVKTTIGDIKPDAYIGVAGMARPDGSIDAFSIHVLPAAIRGQGEGGRPWDARPGSTMINTYFQSSVAAANGRILTVKNKDGEKKVIVSETTAVAMAAPAERSELKPGAQIIVFGSEKQPDDSILIKSMYVGRGLTPGM